MGFATGIGTGTEKIEKLSESHDGLSQMMTAEMSMRHYCPLEYLYCGPELV